MGGSWGESDGSRLLFVFLFFLPPALGAKLVITVAATLTAATPKPEEAHTCRSAAGKKKRGGGGGDEFSGSQTAQRANEKNCLFSNFHVKPCGIKVTTNTIKGVKKIFLEKD